MNFLFSQKSIAYAVLKCFTMQKLSWKTWIMFWEFTCDMGR